ncbi:J domain-containing protein [Amphiplicatus metriothermophilus]|uniref:DnaJ domain-containing protein n=1 Tax=Amphiplicatus metriothermophilus TaxID=1519374 RepID=A0A239PXL9_9PROT|nr:J domain-containing protein [Amphiplicatus metriothermophilus]MBB5519878.1 DnaJ-domain-containing protein 1 [Amphiplicatus metriothermophilus]SNT75071.1 DnaJ domain-containing protein [Amphiplicatus metriothermophilus]
MSDYAYRPRLGFDIRVRPPREEAEEPPVWAAASGRLCDAPDCRRRASVRVAKSPREMHDKLWLCAQHAREHNRRWNFFEGLSDAEAEAIRLASLYGDRPTWAMGGNERARAAARARRPSDFEDAFGLFRGAAPPARETGPTRNGRPVPRLQAQAFETLGLAVTASAAEIRRRYAELVRRFHPDANGGDRSAETQLIAVVRAHQILKKARIC